MHENVETSQRSIEEGYDERLDALVEKLDLKQSSNTTKLSEMTEILERIRENMEQRVCDLAYRMLCLQ